MNDMNCVFCKIAAGGLPAEKVYEDAATLAFLDIKPVNPGHLLVIPKEHYANIFDLPAETYEAMSRTAKKMSETVRKALGTENINVYMNNGAHSGQVVFHAHIHIIPRHEGDGYGLWHGKPYEDGQAEKTAGMIRQAV